MRLVYKFRIPKTEHLDLLSTILKKLYNQANWYIRQDFLHLENWLRYNDLDFILKQSIHYKLLKAKTSQQILKVLDNNWKSFFNMLKEWKKDKKIFNGRPRPPNYKKTCNNILIFTNQNNKIRGSKIILTMSHLFKDMFPKFENPIEVRISKYKNKSFERFQQIRVSPRKRFYIIKIVYNEERKTSKVDTKRYLSIDFGLNNLITTVENTNVKPIIISGRVLKSLISNGINGK